MMSANNDVLPEECRHIEPGRLMDVRRLVMVSSQVQVMTARCLACGQGLVGGTNGRLTIWTTMRIAWTSVKHSLSGHEREEFDELHRKLTEAAWERGQAEMRAVLGVPKIPV